MKADVKLLFSELSYYIIVLILC